MTEDRHRSLSRASALVDLGRHDEALSHLAVVLTEDPTNEQALCLASAAHLGAGRTTEALQTARAAAAVAPDDAWPHRLISHALLASTYSDDRRRAVESARSAVSISPHAWESHYTLALALHAAGQPDQAGAAALAAAHLAPEEASAHAAIAEVASSTGRHGLAEAAWRHVVALDPDDAVALNNLGVELERRGALLMAAREFLAAARLGVDVPEAAANVGQAGWLVLQRLVETSAAVLAMAVAAVLVLVGGPADHGPLPPAALTAAGLCALVGGAVVARSWLRRELPRGFVRSWWAQAGGSWSARLTVAALLGNCLLLLALLVAPRQLLGLALGLGFWCSVLGWYWAHRGRVTEGGRRRLREV